MVLREDPVDVESDGDLGQSDQDAVLIVRRRRIEEVYLAPRRNVGGDEDRGSIPILRLTVRRRTPSGPLSQS